MISARVGDELRIETDAGLRICRVNRIDTSAGYSVDVTTGMGIPNARPKTVKLGHGRSVEGIAVSTGNPHFVIVTNATDFSVGNEPWEKIGAEICTHSDFPSQTNVEFLRVLARNEIEIRIFERGVGPTSSSGTGTSASATAAIGFHKCTSPLRVIVPGGAQTVTWNGSGTELELTGPATLVARGEAWIG